MWPTVIAAVAGLVGVAIGSVLTHRREHEAWLRDKRLALYVELLELLTATSRHFGTDMAVSRLQPRDAANPSHDFDDAGARLIDYLNALDQLRPTASVLAGEQVLTALKRVRDWINRVSGLAQQAEPTIDEWGEVTEWGWAVTEGLASAARTEVHRPIRQLPQLPAWARRA